LLLTTNLITLKSLLKKALTAIGILVLTGLALVAFYSEASPKVIPTQSADAIALKMLDALNVKAWDSLKTITWKSRIGVKYIWNKPSNTAVISWDNIIVNMQLDKADGIVFKNGKEIIDRSAVVKAWEFWCNDSFWMFAHYKIFDKGTTRSLVPADSGKTGLLVSYESGGVTPGDRYLWVLNEKFIPEGFKMWVKIIPIGGTYASWENWTSLSNGLMVAPKHKMKLIEFEFNDIAILK
jgi:hypothetical protein